ncbi:MAG: hypothetical protein E6I52_18435 [Chloroflexi bacterium]|nr:MAG: hypothetical protein E6I52_18435 [Chloroflexota bacterium]
MARTTRANREEIARAGLSRRDMVKLGLLSSSGYLVTRLGLSSRTAEVALAASPPTRPFIQPMPIPPIKQPVQALTPPPQVNPQPGEGRTRPHQALTRFPPQKLYETHAVEVQNFSFHPDLPLQTVWGYDGQVPGPTYHARYGEPILVRMVNDLPQNHKGFGIPQISTHLHNAHTPSESDGFPLDFFPSTVGGSQLFYDQHYPMQLAGFSNPSSPNGDPREALSTLWYHDHRVDFTAQNVYKGLAGFFAIFSDHDTGDESTGFRLPGGDFDVPMILADKVFDSNGQIFFDLFNFDGVLGDKFTVNGKIQPFLQVHPRRYRFRILDGGPSRFYQLFLTDLNNLSRVIPFEHISNDGNLLPQSVTVNNVLLSVSERCDVIVDFSNMAGTSIYLENRLPQFSGTGPSGGVLRAGGGNLLVRFDVVLPTVGDGSLPPPYTFFPAPTPTAAELSAARTRLWTFDSSGDQWVVNDRLFDPNVVMANPSEGTSEIWVLQNDGGEWSHPIHIHFEEFQMLSRNGRTPTTIERGRKDVARLGPDDQVKVFLRFRDFVERYPIHCHITVHEDHAMMARWDIVPA